MTKEMFCVLAAKQGLSMDDIKERLDVAYEVGLSTTFSFQDVLNHIYARHLFKCDKNTIIEELAARSLSGLY